MSGKWSGNVPEYGAIFMSNSSTRKECFQRKLFGLPYPFADFVKAIKAGMILFLFDYEEKNLYGVFEAISDGAIDIVPDAYRYRSSGKRFPAQIRFDVVWNCGPLKEREFRDAIRENYYGQYKFHFGLSKEQVYSLLCLFESKKSRVRISLKVKSTESSSPSVVAPTVDSGASKVLDVPSLLKRKSAALPNKLKEADVASCGASLSLEDYIPLSSPESSDDDSKVKGMYSDLLVEKKSVFSRLNLMPELFEENEKSEIKAERTETLPHLESAFKATAGKEQSKLEAGKSVNEIMERLLQRHTKVRIASGDRFLGKQSNVFSRLVFPSAPAIEKEDLNAKLDETLHKINAIIQGASEKKKRAFEENYHYEEVDLTYIAETVEDVSWSREKKRKHANLEYNGDQAKEWSGSESNNSNSVSMGLCKDWIANDAIENVPSSLPQKKSLSSIICYPNSPTKSFVVHQTCISGSTSTNDASEMAEESTIISLEKIWCEQIEERWQMEEFRSSLD